ncbi:MAG TPA: hypothetical protein VHW66_01565 [Stellaceae bacterium]|nr:hypothetical protein [Stellaceae bacterium]
MSDMRIADDEIVALPIHMRNDGDDPKISNDVGEDDPVINFLDIQIYEADHTIGPSSRVTA